MIPLSAGLVLVLTVALLTAAYASARKGMAAVALACIVLAGGSVRLYAASEGKLHEWDERYHAVVAKHLIQHPLTPTLYDDPVLPYDFRDWAANHVWLHKPPVALWLMAGSLRVFGLSELALRLPDVVFSMLAIVLTFAIGSRLFDTRIALLAAGFHAVNGLLVALTSGRAPTDHVDSLLIVLVELGVLLAIVDAHSDRVWTSAAVGLTLGLGLLTKWYPALLVLPLWLFLMVKVQPIRLVALKALTIITVAVAVVAPWAWYIVRAFPREAIWEWRYGISHAAVVLEEHSGGAWVFVTDLPQFFGELVYIPLVWALVEVVRRPSTAVQLLVLWIVIPYGVFSFAATKMPAYVMIAAPAVFLIEAMFWWQLAGTPRLVRRRTLRAIVLAVFAFLPGRYLLRPGGPFTIADRHPRWVTDLKALGDRVTDARPVLFNMPHPIEGMFYLPWPAYQHMPTGDQARTLAARGYAVLIYDDEFGTVRPYGEAISKKAGP